MSIGFLCTAPAAFAAATAGRGGSIEAAATATLQTGCNEHRPLWADRAAVLAGRNQTRMEGLADAAVAPQ